MTLSEAFKCFEDASYFGVEVNLTDTDINQNTISSIEVFIPSLASLKIWHYDFYWDNFILKEFKETEPLYKR